MFRATANQEFPKVTTYRDCGTDQHVVTMNFEDPIFELGSYVVLRDGAPFAEGPLTGHEATASFSLDKEGLDVKGSTFTVQLFNAEGDESRVRSYVLRSVCVRYAALGDSFSAGEGAFDYDWRTMDFQHALAFGVTVPDVAFLTGEFTDNECHRSSKAYGPQVLELFNEEYRESLESI